MEIGEKELVIICLAISILGISAMLLVAKGAKAEEKSIDGISENDFGKLMLLKGRVAKITISNYSMSMRICETRCIGVFVGEKLLNRMRNGAMNPEEISSGNFVSVEGTLRENNGEYTLYPSEPDSIEMLWAR